MSITISISSYNQAEYLRDAIESALNQTVLCKVLVIDDGSTDNSWAIAQHIALNNKNMEVIHQVNKGLSSARNTGLMNCDTEYILFLDADDILLSNCIERIEQEIKNTDADVIGLSFKEFGIRDTVIQLMPNPTLEDFKVANRIGYCSAIKTDVLRKVGGYSSRMTTGFEDLHLWFNLLHKNKKFVTISDILWLYRTKEKSMIHDAIKHYAELMAQIHKDFPEVKEIINNPLPHANS